MTQIKKIRRKTGGRISYKFYGKELSAGFDVKFIIDNHDILKDAFTPVTKIATMKHLDELRLFFLAKKISDMEEIIPYINSNENKAIAQDLITICHKYYNGIGKGVIIKYINKSYRRIFNKNKLDHALVDVVLDFIFKNNKGIEKSVWMFLADEYGYRLLNEYAKIKKVLLRNDYGSAMLDKMVKIKNPTSLIEYHLNVVFSVLSDILLNHKENDGSIKALSRLTECEKPKSFLDFCSTNMPTSEYFTYSRQLALQTYSNVGSGTIASSNSLNNKYKERQIHISPHFQNAYAWYFRTYVIYLC